MKFTQGIIQEVELYRGYKIVIEHNLNLFENISDDTSPIYTIQRMGRCLQGSIEDVRQFIDKMFAEYGELSND